MHKSNSLNDMLLKASNQITGSLSSQQTLNTRIHDGNIFVYLSVSVSISAIW